MKDSDLSLSTTNRMTLTMESFRLTGVEGSASADPHNRLRPSPLSAENVFSLNTNNLTYPGGQYELSSPVTNHLHALAHSGIG